MSGAKEKLGCIERAIYLLERGWIQGANAVDGRGEPVVSITDMRGEYEGCSFCTVGATIAAAFDSELRSIDYGLAEEVVRDIRTLLPHAEPWAGDVVLGNKHGSIYDNSCVTRWNDGSDRTLLDVLQVLELLKERYEGEVSKEIKS